ncbi:hypothetical protein D3C86_2021750 [compost metagenome]
MLALAQSTWMLQMISMILWEQIQTLTSVAIWMTSVATILGSILHWVQVRSLVSSKIHSAASMTENLVAMWMACLLTLTLLWVAVCLAIFLLPAWAALWA